MPGVISRMLKGQIISPTLSSCNQHMKGIRKEVYVLQLILNYSSSNGKADDYQYIKKSTVPTMHFQKSLPPLPVPKLEDTCQRYLRAQQPLLNAEGFQKTTTYVKEFLENEGKECQKIILMERNRSTSYITQPWTDLYLKDRRPLPINYNPFLVFVQHPKEECNDQAVKATNMVISSLRFYRSLNEGLLEPEVYHMNPAKTNTALFRKVTGFLPSAVSWLGAFVLFKAFPLDMSQYKFLFNTTRIPKLDKDVIKYVPGGKHILVMKGGNFYVFDAFDKNGNIIEPQAIYKNIEHIVRTSDGKAEFPVGVLTTEDRNVWASARNHLESIGNQELLELIDTSVMSLILDDHDYQQSIKKGQASETTRSIEDDTKRVRQFLHSDGRNRWFDKSFSLIVNKDGYAGVNFEHSWGDGVAVLRYFNETFEDFKINPRTLEELESSSQEVTVRKLEFKLDDKSKAYINEADKKYQRLVTSLDVSLLEYNKFGRDLCKPLNVSPDGLMQLAFQMAYHKMKNKFVATYESCSTAAFRHGRTETVRPCTLETQKFCLAIHGASPPSKTELQQMIIECSKYHTNLIKEAAMGQGFDRHLFALKLKAESLGSIPAIFKDPAYANINHNILSTSTLTSNYIYLGAFGPVVPDGYGIGYSIWKERLGFIVTNYSSHTNGPEFLTALESSFKELYEILS